MHNIANLGVMRERRATGVSGRRSGASYLAIAAAVYFFVRAGSVLVAAIPAMARAREAIPVLQFTAIFQQAGVFWAFVIYFGLFALSYLSTSWIDSRRGIGGVLGGLLFLLAAGDAAGLLLAR